MQGHNHWKIIAEISCDGGQNLPPLVGIRLRYLKILGAAPVAPVVTFLGKMSNLLLNVGNNPIL